MAHQLPWESNFSIDDLRVDALDDIYKDFPFFRLKDNGLRMKALNELHSPMENTVRGIGAIGVIVSRQQAIKCSLKKGWDRTSYPIPYIMIDKRATIFDRRHTVFSCIEIDAEFNNIEYVPTAEYERVYPKEGGIFNLFSTESLIKMASMWGNVFGPNKDDTKDHQFENTIVNILTEEAKRLDVDTITLFSLDVTQQILRYMGGHSRYNDQRTLTRIPNNAHAALHDSSTVKGINTTNTEWEDVVKFIANSDEWQDTNTENDDTIFRIYKISTIGYHVRDMANRLIETLCLNEHKHRDAISDSLDVSTLQVCKKVKVLLYNDKKSTKAEEIVESRNKFVKELNKAWYLKRDNVLARIPDNLLDLKDTFRKKLDDFNLEIWCMQQLETEGVHEIVFDQGKWN